MGVARAGIGLPSAAERASRRLGWMPATLREIAPVWFLWCVAFVAALGVLDATSLRTRPDAPFGHFLRPIWWWDYGWYWNLSHLGYRAPMDYAFYPLWPVFLRTVADGPEAAIAAFVAGVSCLLAFAGVAAAAPGSYERRAALAMACFPGSFVLALAYPDALALASSAWACVLAARGRAMPAAALAAVAAVSRPNAFLIAIPLGVLAIRRGGRLWIPAVAPVVAAALVQLWFWSDSGRWDAFAEAQRLWGRDGPGSAVDRWSGNLDRLAHEHAALSAAVLLAVAAAAFALWRLPHRYRPFALAAVYLALACGAVLAAGSDQTRTQTAFIVLTLPLCGLLWTMGSRYRTWSLYAFAVVALSLASGSVISFGRHAIYAFPIFWAIADGPRILRHPAVLATGFAANLAWVLLALPRFPP
jgi:hypothetical protein